jgi:hypothetical protein
MKNNEMETVETDIRGQLISGHRAELILCHPLITKNILLPTLPIKELFLAVRRVVMLRETGCCFTGFSGVGKSCAIDFVAAMLKAKMPGLCVVKHDTHNQQYPSIRSFFKHFLTSIGHKNLRGETYDLRQRLVNWLVDEAKFTGFNMIVLFIDEAHAMTIQDFNFLKDVFNDLDKENVQLVSILMAQEPDFSKVLSTLKQERRLDLIGRFAMRILPFRAYRGSSDLKLILTEIDKAIYPEDTDTTWTEFFFPNAYRNGFRLVGQLDTFMEAINLHAPKGQLVGFVFPARQAFLAIKTFMLDNAGFDNEILKIPSNAWTEAVLYAKIADAMETISATADENPYKIES